MSKIIFNPIDSKVSISINGKDYSVDAGSEILIENDEHAESWKRTHAFLEIRSVDSKEIAKEVIVEIPVEPVDVLEEVPVPDVQVEEPKKVSKSKK